jgi:DNA-binding IclR family transcriptional regulator
MSDYYEVRALARGLQILEILASDTRGLALSTIAREARLAKSSTHRLLQTLMKNGYVAQDSSHSDHYFPTLKLLTLSNKLIEDTNLSIVARPHLEFLARASGETVHLVLLDQGSVVYIEKVESPNPIRMYSQIGNRAPLHCTGVGKAVLAFLPEKQREAFLNSDPLRRYTDHTLAQPDVLREHLVQIRAQGYAIDNGEHEEHVRCIAMPLFARNGQVVGAVSIAAVSYRVEVPTLLSWQPLLAERVRQLNMELAHYFDRYT